MRVRLWGTRGSIASPGPDTVRFGGNTACVEIRSDSGALLVLDCGTGARALGQALVADAATRQQPADGCLLIGHTHWDHIQGLPFFAPLFLAGNTWHVYGPRGLGQSLGQTLAGQMQYQYFPVSVEQLGAEVTFHDLVEGELTLGDIVVRTQYLNHPALTVGYRIEADGATVVYASDHEPHDRALAAGGDLLASPQDARHVEFLGGADLVLHDAQYLAAEYAHKVGWGHSTVEYAVDAARLAEVGTLVLFHHDPARDDAAMDELLGRARAHARAGGYTGDVVVAAEGMAFDVAGSRKATERIGRPPSATFEPVLTDLSGSVIVAAREPVMCFTIRAAADAEQMAVLESSTELPAPPDEGQAVIVVDHDDHRDGLAAVRRTLDGAAAARLVVLAFTRGRPPLDSDGLIADWLVWPSSLGHVRTKLRAAVLRRACRWQNAPLPPDEEARLQSLHALGVLDTEPEERFDRYTRQACDALDVPIALVSMVDADRQWFKSHQGTTLVQTPRDVSMCAHAILGADVFQVPDLLDDHRFADSPAATGAGRARFYAGVPLVLSDGSRVGTLCVMDQRPRVLDDGQLDELRALGALVQAELEPTA